MDLDITFLAFTGTFAVLGLFSPRAIIFVMFRLAEFFARINGVEFPENYRKDFQLLRENPTGFEEKYKRMVAMMRATGGVSLFLFLSYFCVNSGQP